MVFIRFSIQKRGTIKNQFYGGACIVELTLQAPNGIWSFQRRLSQSGGIGPLARFTAYDQLTPKT